MLVKESCVLGIVYMSRGETSVKREGILIKPSTNLRQLEMSMEGGVGGRGRETNGATKLWDFKTNCSS